MQFILFSSNFLDISFVKEKQYEVVVKDEIYTEDMLQDKAIQYVKDKMMKDNPSIREIKNVMIMSSYMDDVGGQFKMFVQVIEDIGEVVLIDQSELSVEKGSD